MEIENPDKITKTILSNSNLELTNPEFNRIIIGKIIRERNKKVMLRTFSYFFTGIIITAVVSFTILSNVTFGNSNITFETDILTKIILTIIQTIKEAFVKYGYSVLSFMILFVIKKFIEVRIKNL